MPLPTPSTWLQLQRSVRFSDTDAAAVMHFHQLLRWCHEADEESLERFGLPAAGVFPRPGWAGNSPDVAKPIVHCKADYFRPLVCGDALTIQLWPHRLYMDSFRVVYAFSSCGSQSRRNEIMARGLTQHRAISTTRRTGCELPPNICAWLENSAVESTESR